MNSIKKEIENELKTHILPFWATLKDDTNGGFYGEVNYDLEVDKHADKGGIQISRFLWSMSAVYNATNNPEYLELATHAYKFLINHVYDHEAKGLYWMVDFKGEPKDTRKHVYVQSFGIYALSEYYRAAKDEAALKLAKELYQTIEEKTFQSETKAYKEEFDRNWQETSNEMLSENGVAAELTMNTHIHILEAYTNLYRVWPDAAVKTSLETLLEVMYEHVYDKDTKFLDVFFDEKWNSLISMKSFGHDIEASWLIDDTLKLLNIEKQEYVQMVTDLAYNIKKYAMQSDGSLINEEVNGETDWTRVWWVQAEAVVGFYNAYERTQDPVFIDLVKGLWNYIQNNIVDPRENGEWLWSREGNGEPTKRNIGDPWKTPYHNTRFCLEIIKRVED